jgi:cytochrome c550
LNPIKVFLSIFAAGIALTLVLGAIGYQQDMAGGEKEQEPAGDTPETLNVPGYMQSCISCHGGDLRGVGTAPSLRNLEHLSKEEIIDVITNGRGGMPGNMAAGNEEAATEYLLTIQNTGAEEQEDH